MSDDTVYPQLETGTGWIQTWSGVAFTPLEPKPEDIRIEDIGHALALQNRYNGHTSFPISVARHSLMVARIVEHFTKAANEPTRVAELALAGLLHDAAEVYIGDFVRPLKDHEFGVEYRKVERQLESAVEARFGLEYRIFHHPFIRRADEIALATEARDLGLLAKAPKPWTLSEDPLPEVGDDSPERWWMPGAPVYPSFALRPVTETPWRDVERAFLLEFERLDAARR